MCEQVDKFMQNVAEDSSTVCASCPHFKWTSSMKVELKNQMFSKKKVKTIVKQRGTCHANPPRENSPVGSFPIVKPNDWCPVHPNRTRSNI